MRTFSLGAGADVVKFTTANEANANTIKNFGTNDTLSFLKSAFGGITWTAESDDFTDTFTSKNIAANKVYFGEAITDDAVAGLQASSDYKALAITQTGNIYYLVDDGSNVTSTLVGSVNIDTLADINIVFATS